MLFLTFQNEENQIELQHSGLETKEDGLVHLAFVKDEPMKS